MNNVIILGFRGATEKPARAIDHHVMSARRKLRSNGSRNIESACRGSVHDADRSLVCRFADIHCSSSRQQENGLIPAGCNSPSHGLAKPTSHHLAAPTLTSLHTSHRK